MKKIIRFSILVLLAATFAPTAKADNPAEWHFSVVTYGARDDDGPLSPPIDTGYLEYYYEWQLTHIEGADPWPALQVEVTPSQYLWVDIWEGIDSGDRSGSGTMGPLPVVDELVLHIAYDGITADFLASVDENGYGTISIDNVIFDPVAGYPVTGARFQGDVTITPEPATILLLGLGSLVLLRKRRA
ncbi:MAG: PEP-CTERM sorting domain-containing protein [Planctomycetota bacterium]|jgi:hypothetical protein